MEFKVDVDVDIVDVVLMVEALRRATSDTSSEEDMISNSSAALPS